MASNIDIYLDAQGGGIQPGGSAAGGALPQFTRNDIYNFRIRVQDSPIGEVPTDIDTSGTTLRLGIGNIDDTPTDGQFKLTCNGTTSSAITFNSTALQIYNAISNNVSTVATFGNEEYSYVLTATQPNTAMSFGGDSFTLFPLSSILINTRRFPATGVQAQQVVKLRRNPAIFSNSFVATSTAGAAVLTKTQDGSSTSNETYRLAFTGDVVGGSFTLNYGSNSTTAIEIGASAVCASQALSAVTGIGANNISVAPLIGENGYSISFVRGLGSQNLATALELDAGGIYFAPFREATVTFATAELDELFAEAGTDTITPTLEIEMTDGGNPKTLHQGSVTIRKDLITTGSSIPADQASYLTAAESYAAFLRNSTTGFSAFGALRDLRSSLGAVLIRGNNTGIAFFGNTPVAQPANINAVSGLINLGLLATGSTYGVLPSSPRTLTTTASIPFGTLSGHAVSAGNVTVTGAAIGDIVLVGLPGAVSGGLVVQGVVFAANTVCMTAINGANTSKTIGTAEFRITVIGY